MIRFAAAAALACLACPAVSQDFDEIDQEIERSMMIQGVAGIIRAQDECNFAVNSDALNQYLDKQGLLNPESLAEIDNQAYLARELTERELSSTQCAMRQATASKIGILTE